MDERAKRPLPQRVTGRLMRYAGVPLAAAVLAFGGATAASADPPAWAPAHGYRAKHHDDDRRYGYHEYHHSYHHKRPERVVVHRHVHEHEYVHRHEHVYRPAPRYPERYRAPPRHRKRHYSAYPDHDPYTLGALVGAAAGGLLGAQIGDGRGQLAATAAGTIAGYVIGGDLGRYPRPYRHRRY